MLTYEARIEHGFTLPGTGRLDLLADAWRALIRRRTVEAAHG